MGLLALFVMAVNSAVAAGAGTNRYNVLFIAVDDLRAELGCYGLDQVRSPHLDRLASQGVLFARHHVQVPTCGASRFAMLTGRSPARSRVSGGNEIFHEGPSAFSREEFPGAQSFPELFRRGGYRTVCIGKISHSADGRVYTYQGAGDGRPELPLAWDEMATPVGQWQRGWGAFFAYTGGRHREDGAGHRDGMEFVAEDDEDLPDGLMAARAVEKLRDLGKGGQRFFLGLGFFKPHLPFVATRADWEAMAHAASPPAHPGKPLSEYWHASGEFSGYKWPVRKSRPLAVEDAVKVRRAYLACVRYVDRQIGKVIDALDTLGLAESTIVVVWGDHGWHLGESGIWGKHTPFERALHSPLIIRVPGLTRAGTRCEALVESIDLYPTLIDLCKPAFTRTHAPLDGRSLLPLLDGSAASVRETSVSYWNKSVSITNATHRLVATRQGGDWTATELYDLRESPDPVENLAVKQPEVVASLLRSVPAVSGD